jgi:hypothetical protein
MALDQGASSFRSADIGGDAMQLRIAAKRVSQRMQRLIDTFLRAPVDDDLGARASKFLSDCIADAGRRAGDEGALVLQGCCHWLSHLN